MNYAFLNFFCQASRVATTGLKAATRQLACVTSFFSFTGRSYFSGA